MREWLIGLGVAILLLLASWGLLIILAKRLPSGHPVRPRRLHSRLHHHRAPLAQRPSRPSQSQGRHRLRRDLGRQPHRPHPRVHPGHRPARRHHRGSLALRYAGCQVTPRRPDGNLAQRARLIERLLGQPREHSASPNIEIPADRDNAARWRTARFQPDCQQSRRAISLCRPQSALRGSASRRHPARCGSRSIARRTAPRLGPSPCVHLPRTVAGSAIFGPALH